MKTITLSNGIVLKDRRSISCGIQIENDNNRYVNLIYRGTKQLFYLNPLSTYLYAENVESYTKELTEMQVILQEANDYLLKNQQPCL